MKAVGAAMVPVLGLGAGLAFLVCFGPHLPAALAGLVALAGLIGCLATGRWLDEVGAGRDDPLAGFAGLLMLGLGALAVSLVARPPLAIRLYLLTLVGGMLGALGPTLVLLVRARVLPEDAGPCLGLAVAFACAVTWGGGLLHGRPRLLLVFLGAVVAGAGALLVLEGHRGTPAAPARAWGALPPLPPDAVLLLGSAVLLDAVGATLLSQGSPGGLVPGGGAASACLLVASLLGAGAGARAYRAGRGRVLVAGGLASMGTADLLLASAGCLGPRAGMLGGALACFGAGLSMLPLLGSLGAGPDPEAGRRISVGLAVAGWMAAALGVALARVALLLVAPAPLLALAGVVGLGAAAGVARSRSLP